MLANYGIEIRDVGIKQLGVSEKVTQDVFDRMRADRKRKTEATIAAGTAEATRIRTDAESKRTELLAAAQARAKAIRGQGDAEAAQYYKQLEEDPELAIFLRQTEALQEDAKERSTIVLSAESEPFKLFREMPKINRISQESRSSKIKIRKKYGHIRRKSINMILKQQQVECRREMDTGAKALSDALRMSFNILSSSWLCWWSF